MKAKKKTLLILVLVLALLCAVAAIATLNNKTQEPVAEGETLIEIKKTDSSQIAAFTLKNGDESYSFEYMVDGWILSGDANFPVNAKFISSTLSTLEQISAVKRLDGAQAMSEYGLEEPKMHVNFTDLSGIRLNVYIGDYNSYNGYYYARFDDNSDVFMIDRSLVSLCEKKESDMIALDSLPSNMSAADFTSLTVGDKEYTAESEDASALWDELKALSTSDYVDYYLDDDEAEELGLVEATLKYATAETSGGDYSSSTVTASVAHDALFAFAATDDGVLFTYEDSRVLYRMDKEKLPVLCSLISDGE